MGRATFKMIEEMLGEGEVVFYPGPNAKTVAALLYRPDSGKEDIGSEYERSVGVALCSLYEEWKEE